MSGAPLVPSSVDGSRVSVTQQTIRLIDCPKCDQTLNITELNVGGKIKCFKCDNVTWHQITTLDGGKKQRTSSL